MIQRLASVFGTPENRLERDRGLGLRFPYGAARIARLGHVVTGHRVETFAFRDLGLSLPSGTQVVFEEPEEASELLSAKPAPTEYDAHPKYILWSDNENPEVTENGLFHNVDVTVSSIPQKEQIAVELEANARDGAVLNRRAHLTTRLIEDAVLNEQLTYLGKVLDVKKHYPGGKGIGFSFMLDAHLSVSVEFYRDIDEDSESTLLKIRVSSKGSSSTGTEMPFKGRIANTLDVAVPLFNTITALFTDTLATTPTEPLLISLPIQRLRNRQSSKQAHESVEPPKGISGGDELALFQEIARNPRQYDFNLVGGLEQQIAEARRLITISQNSGSFAEYGLEPNNCVIFHGPPGTGKTLIAEVAASELGGYYLKIDCSDILNKWVGESEAKIRTIFRLVKKLSRDKPVLVFFDEFDVLGRRKKDNTPEWMRSITNTVLTSLADLPRNCIAMAAVNEINDLEPAIRREGRFSQVRVDYPDESTRLQILNNWVRFFDEYRDGRRPFDEGIDLTRIAKLAKDFTGADIKSLLDRTLTDAVIGALNESDDTNPGVRITTSDIERSLLAMKKLKEEEHSRPGQYL